MKKRESKFLRECSRRCNQQQPRRDAVDRSIVTLRIGPTMLTVPSMLSTLLCSSLTTAFGWKVAPLDCGESVDCILVCPRVLRLQKWFVVGTHLPRPDVGVALDRYTFKYPHNMAISRPCMKVIAINVSDDLMVFTERASVKQVNLSMTFCRHFRQGNRECRWRGGGTSANTPGYHWKEGTIID